MPPFISKDLLIGPMILERINKENLKCPKTK